MTTIAWINLLSFFYPLGNTPAICLTQDLTYKEKAKVLLLGCGDVRNILFTVYADGGYGKVYPLKLSSSYYSNLFRISSAGYDLL